MITPEDKELLAKKGISEVQIAEQLACFQKGFPYLKLDAAASVEKGILASRCRGAESLSCSMGCLYQFRQNDCEVCTRFGCCQPYVQESI